VCSRSSRVQQEGEVMIGVVKGVFCTACEGFS